MDRFIIRAFEEGFFIASIYADRAEWANEPDAANGCGTMHFYRGDEIIASVEMSRHIRVDNSTKAIGNAGQLWVPGKRAA